MYSPRIDRAFLRMIFTLVLPIAVQQLINACITSTDIMMLGRVSESAIAGVSLAGQVSFLLNLILIGISSGASILCSQYWGKKDLRSIEELMGFSLCAGLFVSVIFTVTAFCAPLSVMGLFTSDPVIANQGAQYLRIVCFSYPLNCCTFIYLSIMRSMEHVKISSIIYLFSLLINVLLNYIFIFGHFGSPVLGTAGAAAGTCGARLSELLLAWIYEEKYNRTARFHLRNLYVKNIALVRKFFHFALPVLMNELAWGLGYTVLASIIGHLGQNIVAANSINTVLRQLSMIFSTGLASAAAIITGKTIGEGNRPLVLNYSRNFIKLSVVFGCLGATASFNSRICFRFFHTPQPTIRELFKNYDCTDQFYMYFPKYKQYHCFGYPPLGRRHKGGYDYGSGVTLGDRNTFRMAVRIYLEASFSGNLYIFSL